MNQFPTREEIAEIIHQADHGTLDKRFCGSGPQVWHLNAADALLACLRPAWNDFTRLRDEMLKQRHDWQEQVATLNKALESWRADANECHALHRAETRRSDALRADVESYKGKYHAQKEQADYWGHVATEASADLRACAEALAKHECPLDIRPGRPSRVVWCGTHHVYHSPDIDAALARPGTKSVLK